MRRRSPCRRGGRAQTGWSAADAALSGDDGTRRPERAPSGYRLYGLRELNQLRSLRELRERLAVELDELAFAARLRREPELRGGRDVARTAATPSADWVDWEQRKHERLLVA